MPSSSETMACYEDILIVFLIRLAQLRGKVNPAQSAPPSALCGAAGPWAPAAADSDAFVSYLAVARQFWVRNEPTCYRKVAQILLSVAQRLRDRDLQRRVRALGRVHRRHAKGTITLTHGTASLRVSVETLAELWFNQLYFHTDLNSVDAVEQVLADAAWREQARREFAEYLEALVHYVRQLGAEVAHVLEKQVLPPGRLHSAIEGDLGRALLRDMDERSARPVTV